MYEDQYGEFICGYWSLKDEQLATKYMYLQILEGNLAHDPLNLINYLQISLFL